MGFGYQWGERVVKEINKRKEGRKWLFLLAWWVSLPVSWGSTLTGRRRERVLSDHEPEMLL